MRFGKHTIILYIRSMREKKLTYNEITTLASRGLYDAIPNGYVIEWLPNPPGNFIDLE